jgi:hypothetical protein
MLFGVYGHLDSGACKFQECGVRHYLSLETAFVKKKKASKDH